MAMLLAKAVSSAKHRTEYTGEHSHGTKRSSGRIYRGCPQIWSEQDHRGKPGALRTSPVHGKHEREPQARVLYLHLQHLDSATSCRTLLGNRRPSSHSSTQ